MIILLGLGVATVVGVFYMAKKGWHALHAVVGITPGTLIYQNPNTPLLYSAMTWQALTLNAQHLAALTQSQLQQLKRIDEKLSIYQQLQVSEQQQDKSPPINEAQFILHKLLYTRLPEILASHHRMMGLYHSSLAAGQRVEINGDNKREKLEANELLQRALDNIETRLDSLLEGLKHQSLQELRMMNTYLNSQP